MIISEKHKYIFISTPKCGTHSMFKLLQTYFDGKRIRTNGFHSTKIPDNINISDYTVFTTVRNPYDRLVALWYSILYVREDYIKSWSRVLPDLSLESFTKLLVDHKYTTNKIRARMSLLVTPQYLWVKQMPQKTIYLQIENIETQFKQLSFVANNNYTIPHELSRHHPKWSELKNNTLIQLANNWAEKDFETFGYIPEIIQT